MNGGFVYTPVHPCRFSSWFAVIQNWEVGLQEHWYLFVWTIIIIFIVVIITIVITINIIIIIVIIITTFSLSYSSPLSSQSFS